MKYTTRTLAAFLLLTPCLASASPAVSRTGAVTATFGPTGLSSLTFRGSSFLAQPGDGSLGLDAPPVSRGGSVPAPPEPETTIFDQAHRSVLLRCSWGAIRCSYQAAGGRLNFRVTIHNTGNRTLDALTIRLARLTFPGVPLCTELDAGQFGKGGLTHPLSDYPVTADPRAAPPIVFADYGTGSLAFCSDNPADPAAVEVSPRAGAAGEPTFAFEVSTGPIRPGQTAARVVSFRFGPAHSTTLSLAGDVVRRYAAAYPFQVHWKDHRAIGTLFLASAGAHPAANPRGWFNNAADVDVTTPPGLGRFRAELLSYADNSIKILKSMDAQGMITWDPEGQEFSQATYYGDPRLAGTLAPETNFRGPDGAPVLDEYFARFRAAGFRVGVCIRPQEIRFVSGKPVQEESPDAAATLERKISYARKRWGCTLFYVDSTVDRHGNALDAGIFRRAADAFPDVLLMPENETLRDYAYSAPLNSFEHHAVTSTPPGAREVYPHAFSVLLAGFGDFAAHRSQLVEAVRRGDILLFHGWWPNPNNAIMKSIYDEAYRNRAHH